MTILEYLIRCTCCSSSVNEASASDGFKGLESVWQAESDESRNRRKCSIKSGSAAAEWRPSLKAISEDNIVAVKRSNSSTGSEKTLKRKVSPMQKSKVPTRRSEDYRSPPIPGIIPAFAPTLFMF
ncbi:uncharacterized protein LOC141682856 [Apium graveolens]|uniref:uncharacterized protein LOC141682856 n=1 Tax=Apium graveolens TaxID=4045 RepID=UPI003D7A2A07